MLLPPHPKVCLQVADYDNVILHACVFTNP